MSSSRAERSDWVSDPRFFADGELLAALHVDLRAQLGALPAAGVLLRAGFLHGLSGDWPEALEARALRAAGGTGCWLSAGYTSGWLSGLEERDVLALERHCAAAEAGACRFEARSASAWIASGDREALAALDALPFAALRDEAERTRAEAEPRGTANAFDPESPAVHVWGPVMVVPYAGAETAVAVQAVAREPAAAGVTVIVVDFGGACLDEGFGAAAVERALEAIEARGAEAVIAGLSPGAARIVAGLGRAELVVRSDLQAAIATAFQIAESQRSAT